MLSRQEVWANTCQSNLLFEAACSLLHSHVGHFKSFSARCGDHQSWSRRGACCGLWSPVVAFLLPAGLGVGAAGAADLSARRCQGEAGALEAFAAQTGSVLASGLWRKQRGSWTVSSEQWMPTSTRGRPRPVSRDARANECSNRGGRR